jgi:hypothetical protein
MTVKTYFDISWQGPKLDSNYVAMKGPDGRVIVECEDLRFALDKCL